MSDVRLPPKPNPNTGMPRPPAAPLDNSWGRSHRRPTDRATSSPAPPAGQGPALEWIPRSWRSLRHYFVLYVILLIGFLTLKNWGITWFGDWVLWLTVLILSALGAAATWASDDMEAGADWFKYGKSWVKTYELTAIRLEKAWGSDRLELKDAHGRAVSIQILGIQTNPDLWNLVYNGILHSVHYGGAVANERAVARLRLDEPKSFPAKGEQRQ
jgi:hypothetical protein